MIISLMDNFGMISTCPPATLLGLGVHDFIFKVSEDFEGMISWLDTCWRRMGIMIYKRENIGIQQYMTDYPVMNI